jgi:hypothetical protein
MKRLLVILFFIGLSKIGFTQCNETIMDRTMQPGMFIFGNIDNDPTKKYVAQVLTVNGSSFTCRFLHSNSIYQFTGFRIKSPASRSLMMATVQSSKGGGYKAGTVFSLNVYMVDPEPCDISTVGYKDPYKIIATFVADNKSYFGQILKTPNGYKIYFLHSGATYYTDNNFKVIKTDKGGYVVGSAIKVEHARRLEFYIFKP